MPLRLARVRRAVFPGALMRKRGTHGEFREIGLVGRDRLVYTPLAPHARSESYCWAELCRNTAGLDASGLLMGRLCPSFHCFHLVPRCILLEACPHPAHICIEQTHFFSSLLDASGIPGTVYRKIEMFLLGTVFLLRKL